VFVNVDRAHGRSQPWHVEGTTQVKPGYKRMQHYRIYATAKAYSLARIYSEIYSILKLYSTQCCRLLAEV
jgi:hypothetical protein